MRGSIFSKRTVTRTAILLGAWLLCFVVYLLPVKSSSASQALHLEVVAREAEIAGEILVEAGKYHADKTSLQADLDIVTRYEERMRRTPEAVDCFARMAEAVTKRGHGSPSYSPTEPRVIAHLPGGVFEQERFEMGLRCSFEELTSLLENWRKAPWFLRLERTTLSPRGEDEVDAQLEFTLYRIRDAKPGEGPNS